MAGSIVVKIGVILLHSGSTCFTILPPYKATEFIPTICWNKAIWMAKNMAIFGIIISFFAVKDSDFNETILYCPCNKSGAEDPYWVAKS